MSIAELLALLMSALALAFSIVSFQRTTKLQQKALELQESPSDLAKRQLREMNREAEQRTLAAFKVHFEPNGNNYRLIAKNIGQAPAHNVQVSLTLQRPEQNPLLQQDVEAKLPVPRIAPGENVSLFAIKGWDTPDAFNGAVTWDDADGKQFQHAFYVTY